jgi:2-keto-4-pentenoate hydratase/2-oxohepta-3-ene-1,7-dioic acid hydratase in catechol pathway
VKGTGLMELMRLGVAGAETPVVRVDGATFSIASLTPDIDGGFLAADGIARVREAVAAGSLPAFDATGVRIGPPIARPTAVICIGQNYAAHAAESGSPPPEHPILFHKHPNTIVGPDDDVRIPRGATQTDWEVELGVVIGTRVRYLDSPADALRHVAGYVVSNDVSERHFQRDVSGGQWSKGKNAETFNPLGPALIPADQVDPQALHVWSRVNGEPRQDSSTADMIFSVADLLYDLSQVMVLEPGDLLNSGTPQGVALGGNFPYLVAGDVMEVGIDGLGQQRSRLVPAP